MSITSMKKDVAGYVAKYLRKQETLFRGEGLAMIQPLVYEHCHLSVGLPSHWLPWCLP